MSTGEELQILSGPPVVRLKRIEGIETYEVMASDLDSLDSLMSRENQALAFATSSGGIAIPTFIAYFVAASLTPTATAVYLSVGGLALLSTLWFGVTYQRVRKERPRLLRKIRGEK